MSAEFKKLKILISHYGVKDGGGFCRSYMLAKELANMGNYVTFLTSQSNEFIFPYKKEIINNVLLISFPEIVPAALRRVGFGILNVLLKSVYVLFHKYDIVHSDCGHRPSSGIPCIINKFFKKSSYISEWWDYFGKGGEYNLRPLFKRLTLGICDLLTEVPNKKIADGVVALSEFTKTRAINYGIHEGKIAVINGGSDVFNIKYYPDDRNKAKYGIPKDYLVFCFIGMNDVELNDIIPLIESITILKSKIKVKWFTTGRKLNKKIKNKLKISDELIEFGWLDYKVFSEVISCADIFILLQKENNINQARWPNKLGDYLAAGRLILTNPVGELTTLIKKYPQSFISVSYNKSSIKTAILKLYESKQDLYKIGKINRKIAEEDLSWEKQTNLLYNFYCKILNNKKL